MTRSLDRPAHAAKQATAGTGAPVLEAAGIEKAYCRGIWPARRSTQVLRGADLALHPGEIFIDLGIEQSAMLHPVPPGWAQALPGYGASRVLVDAP